MQVIHGLFSLWPRILMNMDHLHQYRKDGENLIDGRNSVLKEEIGEVLYDDSSFRSRMVLTSRDRSSILNGF